MANITHKLFSSRVKVPASSFIGDTGRVFYHEDTGEFRISDGITPGGLPIFGAGNTGGSGTLLLYKENGTPITTPIANATPSVALGDGSLAHLPGSLVFAAGTFGQIGDAQAGTYVARGVTTNSTQSELFLNGTTARLLIPQNASMTFTATIVAQLAGAAQDTAAFELRGVINRGATVDSTRIVGVVSKMTIAEDSRAWDAFVEADAINGALKVKVQGQNGKTIRWVAHIQTVEVRV